MFKIKYFGYKVLCGAARGSAVGCHAPQRLGWSKGTKGPTRARGVPPGPVAGLGQRLLLLPLLLFPLLLLHPRTVSQASSSPSPSPSWPPATGEHLENIWMLLALAAGGEPAWEGAIFIKLPGRGQWGPAPRGAALGLGQDAAGAAASPGSSGRPRVQREHPPGSGRGVTAGGAGKHPANFSGAGKGIGSGRGRDRPCVQFVYNSTMFVGFGGSQRCPARPCPTGSNPVLVPVPGLWLVPAVVPIMAQSASCPAAAGASPAPSRRAPALRGAGTAQGSPLPRPQ